MLKEDYHKFTSMYENKTLVAADDPAYLIASLVTGKATKELSGKSYSWDDPKFASFQGK